MSADPAALYHRAIVAAARAAAGAGRLERPAASATVDNPLCGDRVTVEVALGDGRVTALAHRVRGCLLCEAAASVIGARAPGEPVAAVLAVAASARAFVAGAEGGPDPWWEELGMFAPVRAYPSRHQCVLLPFTALERALAPSRSEAPPTPGRSG